MQKGELKMKNLYELADLITPFIRMRPDYFEITITPRRDGDNGVEHPEPQTIILDKEDVIELRDLILTKSVIVQTKRDIVKGVASAYNTYDTELNSYYFAPFESKTMTEYEILEAYREIQNRFNGDYILCFDPKTAVIEGRTIKFAEVMEFKEEDYDKVYRGSIRTFLESFNGREAKTGLARVDYFDEDREWVENVEMFDFIF